MLSGYVAHLKSRNAAPELDGEYRKWLRYYLNFCDKYPVPTSKADPVLRKIEVKGTDGCSTVPGRASADIDHPGVESPCFEKNFSR